MLRLSLLSSSCCFGLFCLSPRRPCFLKKEATSQIFVAERYFEQDSLQLALNGDGQYPGFVEIADEYGMTKTGNLAHYYAGVSYLKLGEMKKLLITWMILRAMENYGSVGDR
ncbi:MAG: hypothetical protein U5L09_02100 [Bacteroidales bacterium]|nr:hypothetical protein [Bacteroidales bacterium]